MKKGVTLSKLNIVIILLTFTHHVVGSLMTYHYAQQYEDRTILALLMHMNGYQKKHVPEGQRRTRLSSELSKASYKGQVLKVASLLKARAHPDVRSEHYWTPLHLAAYNGSKKIVELLLNAGAHKDAQEKKDGRRYILR